APQPIEIGALNMHRDTKLGTEPAHERCILVRFPAAQAIVHMRCMQREPWNAPAVPELLQHREKADRVGASRDRHEYSSIRGDQSLPLYLVADASNERMLAACCNCRHGGSMSSSASASAISCARRLGPGP